ncbi:transmembrane protein 53-like [Oppia nitens]|uniref:transmembrane protein 53-like n=1 Tax=Oppia nitens TaxID=1686743 RepID=UPI0023D9F364|nr:transmembrane protein 53-like [Oppia nitens]
MKMILIKVFQRNVCFAIKANFSTTAAINKQAGLDTSTRILAKSITLKHLNYQSSRLSTIEDKNSNESDNSLRSRPLVVLLTWLMAQEKHVDKYSNLYLQKGFDVLTVKTNPFDLMFPSIGSRKIAQNCVTALNTELSQYPSVILHAFSVGAYQFGEMLLEIQKQQIENNEDKDGLNGRIKGIVFDSVVPFEELSNGVSRSLTTNPFLYKIIKSSINGHLKVCKRFATKYYKASSQAVWGNYMRVPALVLVSQNDRIGTASANRRLTDVWRKLGIDVTFKCWDESGHVQHLPKHPIEYEELIDKFLNKINIHSNIIRY